MLMKRLLPIIALIVVAAAGVWFLSSNQRNTNSGDPEPTDNASVPGDVSQMDVYTDEEFGYQIALPDGFTVERQNEYSILMYPEEQPMGVGTANFIYVSVVPPHLSDSDGGEVYNYNANDYQKLIEVENIGESTTLAELGSGLEEWFTYTVVAVEEFDDARVKNFENTKPWEFPAGTTENRFIYDTGVNKYILGYYTGGDGVEATIDPRIAKAVVLSFKPEL
jgi:hypothetical protein